MLIGVISDSHDNLPMIGCAVRRLSELGAEMLLHAGDYVSPFALRLLVRAGIPLGGVFGNNDGKKAGLRKIEANIFEGPHRFLVGGRSIVVAHTAERLAECVSEDDDLAVFGHTHEAEISVGPPLTVNPGELGGWLSGHVTGALVDLKTMRAEIVEFGTQERPML